MMLIILAAAYLTSMLTCIILMLCAPFICLWFSGWWMCISSAFICYPFLFTVLGGLE